MKPTGLEMQQKGPNYYSLLGVTQESNPLEIKRAYKRLSLQLHPDKNPSPDASDQFDTVKQAYDVLMDLELREVYNKFGKVGKSLLVALSKAASSSRPWSIQRCCSRSCKASKPGHTNIVSAKTSCNDDHGADFSSR